MARPNDDDLFLEDLAEDILREDAGQVASDTSAPAPANDSPARNDFEDVDDVPGQLAVDVYQTKEDVVVVAPVPGVAKNDVEISLVENTLTIKGSRSHTETIKRDDFFAQELHWGEFSRSIVLPAQVKEEGAEAELKDGMLSVKVPKAEQDKIKKISIKD